MLHYIQLNQHVTCTKSAYKNQILKPSLLIQLKEHH